MTAARLHLNESLRNSWPPKFVALNNRESSKGSVIYKIPWLPIKAEWSGVATFPYQLYVVRSRWGTQQQEKNRRLSYSHAHCTTDHININSTNCNNYYFTYSPIMGRHGCTGRSATTRERAAGAPAAAAVVHMWCKTVSPVSSKRSTTNMTSFCISAVFCGQGLSLISPLDYA